jgi:SLOG cluster2
MSTLQAHPYPWSSTKAPLTGQMIGASISDSPDEDLRERGLTKEHVDQAFLRLSGDLLAAGASLAYGGDHRASGFTRQLLAYVEKHPHSGPRAEKRIRNYLASPIYRRLPEAERERFQAVAELIEVEPPADAREEAKHLRDTKTLPERYVMARCLTEMRERMSKDIRGRVLLGGKVTGFQGRYPGLLEEAAMALRDRKPLFLIGAFGGCTRVIVDAMLGKEPKEFTLEYQKEHSAGYGEFVEFYNKHGATGPINYDGILRWFGSVQNGDLHNGLTGEENLELFQTRSHHLEKQLTRTSELIVKGLRNA